MANDRRTQTPNDAASPPTGRRRQAVRASSRPAYQGSTSKEGPAAPSVTFRVMAPHATVPDGVAPPTPDQIARALPRPLQRCLKADGWTLESITPQGTLVWRRASAQPRPDGWSEADHWALRKAIRAYGLGTHPLGHDGLGMVMFKATPFVVARAVDRARTDHTLLFDAHGRLPSAALVVEARLTMPPVKRVDTRWHARLLVETLDIARSDTPQELAMWLRHAFAESDINPFPEADLNEPDGVAGPYELAFPVLETLARSVGMTALAALMRAAHRRMQAWAREQDVERLEEWARLERSLAMARR